MSPEVAIEHRLLAWTALTARVQNRIFQVKLPQRVKMPAIRIQLQDHPQGKHLRGPQTTTVALIYIDCYDEDASNYNPYLVVDAMAEDVNDALVYAPFTVGSPAAIRITSCERTDMRAMFEAGELRMVRKLLEYEVWSKPMT